MEKIKRLKEVLKIEKIEGYLLPKNDEFFGEYVSKEKDRLNYITNFKGSFGFSLILKNTNYLFVDGRYTLQATNQCGKHFKIVTMPNKMPSDILKDKRISIGFDPKLFTSKTLRLFFGKTSCKFQPINKNLIDKIWNRNTYSNKNKFYRLPKHSIGKDYKFKIDQIVSYLRKKGADYQFTSSSENNAWLLNIRGKDSKYVPIPNSYILIDKYKNIIFFCDLKKINSSFKRSFKKVKFIEIKSAGEILSKIYKKKFIIDENTCSYYFEKIISRRNKILRFSDQIYNLKSIKNKKEIDNIKKAHIHDGAALTKYLFWIKKNFNKKKITEISGSQKLYRYRNKYKTFKSLSFPTISGSGPNGAIIHYKASNKTNRRLKSGDIYLVDSGGQYEFGTTDVTRTISLKNHNKRIKNIYTRVLKGHIAVANFKLKASTSGSVIDVQARKFLKQIGLNYPHGTGHGVGYFLNVHEGPHSISKNNKVRLREGMIVSNEPGYYEKNKFGIRIENLIYVKKSKNKIFFENLTMAPIDKSLIIKKMLSKKEKEWLNNYHKKVFKNIKNEMNRSEVNELKKACSAI